MMKCNNPDCLMNARHMPRIKKGAVSDFLDAARERLGVTKDQCLSDDSLRTKVLAIAKTISVEDHPELACCGDCTEWSLGKLGAEKHQTVLMIPYLGP